MFVVPLLCHLQTTTKKKKPTIKHFYRGNLVTKVNVDKTECVDSYGREPVMTSHHQPEIVKAAQIL